MEVMEQSVGGCPSAPIFYNFEMPSCPHNKSGDQHPGRDHRRGRVLAEIHSLTCTAPSAPSLASVFHEGQTGPRSFPLRPCRGRGSGDCPLTAHVRHPPNNCASKRMTGDVENQPDRGKRKHGGRRRGK